MRLHGLYALADPALRPDLPLPDLCARLASGGAAVVQIRWKGAPARDLLAAARAALPLVHAAGAALVVNDRPDVALLAGADGVHVGAEDLPVAEVRKLVGDRLAIGATVRDLEGARAAAAAGADHVGFGPIYATGTKVVDAAPRGLEVLRVVAAESPVPVVAIAGIELANIAAVGACGPAAAAVCSAAIRAPDVEAATRALAEAFAAGARLAGRP
ncbi:thiamine phosphate synthase [Vulgatibacter sp.]|uniref:thiamine phosphate synthase n=1 Tax=Vulgatibacter sp. TaxID=1971226 RepID=UPI00356263BC